MGLMQAFRLTGWVVQNELVARVRLRSVYGWNCGDKWGRVGSRLGISKSRCCCIVVDNIAVPDCDERSNMNIGLFRCLIWCLIFWVLVGLAYFYVGCKSHV